MLLYHVLPPMSSQFGNLTSYSVHCNSKNHLGDGVKNALSSFFIDVEVVHMNDSPSEAAVTSAAIELLFEIAKAVANMEIEEEEDA